ncbi:hypothetical protein B0H11DRAFT_1902360 [Mycena galericulata]|nr:hypothetical protein B0H11DRAFT_1902360 [Mycena galericulata]
MLVDTAFLSSNSTRNSTVKKWHIEREVKTVNLVECRLEDQLEVTTHNQLYVEQQGPGEACNLIWVNGSKIEGGRVTLKPIICCIDAALLGRDVESPGESRLAKSAPNILWRDALAALLTIPLLHYNPMLLCFQVRHPHFTSEDIYGPGVVPHPARPWKCVSGVLDIFGPTLTDLSRATISARAIK